jgi:hypothetical protein
MQYECHESHAEQYITIDTLHGKLVIIVNFRRAHWFI